MTRARVTLPRRMTAQRIITICIATSSAVFVAILFIFPPLGAAGLPLFVPALEVSTHAADRAVQAALELKIPFDLRPPQNLLKSSTKYPLGCSSSMSDFQWSSQSVERALSTLPLGVGSLVLDTRPLLDKVAIIGRLVGPQKNAADLGSSRRK